MSRIIIDYECGVKMNSCKNPGNLKKADIFFIFFQKRFYAVFGSIDFLINVPYFLKNKKIKNLTKQK